jgi:hypothetical protein
MGQSSKLHMSRGQKIKGMASTLLVVWVALFVGDLQPAFASLACGTKPKIATEDGARQIKSNVQLKVDRIRQAPRRTNLRALVTASRRELWQSYANVEKSELDHYLLWVTCQTISNDPALEATQMFDEYSNLYRLMSEPLDQPAAADE